MSGKQALKVIKGLKKLNDKERAVIGWKSVLFQSTKHRAELSLSRHLPNCTMSDHLPDFSLACYR